MGAQVNQLIVTNLRNLQALDLALSPHFNIFTGDNGSGKTSLLEALHLLGLGRSFRAKSMRQVITFGAKQCLVRAQICSSNKQEDNIWLALERCIDGEATYKVGGQAEKSAAELSKLLPVQLIDVNSHLVLDGGPVHRRQFMDWGVFHVEHNFLQDWRAMQRALEQRNMALKHGQKPAEVWNEAYVKYAMAVDEARAAYMLQFTQVFLALIYKMLGLQGIEVRYNRGWSPGQDLHTVLQDSMFADLQYGYTTKGPQRANFEVLHENRPVKDVFSRGQMKLFVCIMLLARAQLLPATKTGVFLIDDLHAELDQHSCSVFMREIKNMGCQVFITGTEARLLRESLHDCAARMFHVEHGTIKELTVDDSKK